MTYPGEEWTQNPLVTPQTSYAAYHYWVQPSRQYNTR